MLPGDLKPGALINDRYRIERPLGRGGMGAVFVATHEGLGRKVALKVLDLSIENNPEAVERFKREGRAAAAIGHPGVVEVLDTGTTEWGMPFLVMEYLEGPTLRQFFKALGPVSPELAAAIAAEMLETLVAAHQKGILHRDLKPANVILVPRPQRAVKLLDFGISKFLRSVTVITRTGVALGTPAYMSPEQMAGEKELTAASDLYSVGVMLFELVAGRLPFVSGNELQLMRMVVMTQAPPLATVASAVPAPFCAVVDRLLRKEPSERFGSAEEARRALVQAANPATERLWAQVEPLAEAPTRALAPPAERATPDPSLDSLPPTRDLEPQGTTRRLARQQPRRSWVPLALGGTGALAAKTLPAPKPKPEPVVVAPAPAKASDTDKLIDEARELNKKADYERARTKLTTCIKLEPTKADCHKLLGIVYANLHDNKKGVFHYKKFLEFAPNDPSAPKVKAIVDAYESTQK